MADRLYPGKALWDEAAKLGAQLLWRVKKDIRLDVDEVLSDGSYLSRFCADSDRSRKKRTKGTLVRVVCYRLPGSSEVYRLITTLLDPELYPAQELARLYPHRWDVETVYKELKYHLPKGKTIIRSQSADMVKQEVYGMLLAHRAIRSTMLEASVYGNVHPDSISLTRTVEVVTASLPLMGSFPP